MKRLGVVAAALVLACASSARADTPPSMWERARDPEAAEAFDLHQAVQRRLIRTAIAAVDFGERGRVLAMLERAGAERSKSALLRFDLGHVYVLLEDHTRAAQVLDAAVKAFPDHPAVDQAWLRLALACGHLGDHACERRAYVEVLRRETEELMRATPTLNLAETEMHLGDLKEAIAGYREALRIAGRVPARETAPLATWGLAVALDRSGDGLAAEKEARFALEMQHSMGLPRLLRSTDVFFVPDYEIHWYEGLGAAARARAATSPREATAFWGQAERSFGAYVRGAESKHDRWLAIAKARLAEAQAERARAEKRAPSEKPRREPFGEDLQL
ncbi:MAG: tetratricopeptide repeat protein [Labilithrix sp.]|nr:tetratricopeptide repeat protein [Labilithrix sp.]